MSEVYTVTLEPVGVAFEVEPGETVLDAAFRQGIGLPHGCKEGQCAACKCQLVDGEVEMLRYSTFALNDSEREQGGILLCRSRALSDVTVELLNYDEEVLSKSIAVRDYEGRIVSVARLTHDIRAVEIVLAAPMRFHAGQYADVTVAIASGETVTRSFSMANTPERADRLSFIIKKYPEGRFSGELDTGGIAPGARVSVRGPFGVCFRRENRDGPMILVAAGSGMAPIWSILHDHIASGERRPVLFFYGARTQADLFYLEPIRALTEARPEIEFIPALSHAEDDAGWNGARGFVHEVVRDTLKARGLGGDGDVYACGPPPMIDALGPVLFMQDIDPARIFFDRFTASTAAPTR